MTQNTQSLNTLISTIPDKCKQYQASIPNQQTIATPNSFQAA